MKKEVCFIHNGIVYSLTHFLDSCIFLLCPFPHQSILNSTYLLGVVVWSTSNHREFRGGLPEGAQRMNHLSQPV